MFSKLFFPNKPEQKNVIAVQDVSYIKIDEDTKTIRGCLDLGTAPFNGSFGNRCDFKSEYICQYKNFYLLAKPYVLNGEVNFKRGVEYHDVVRVLPDVNSDRPEGYGPWMKMPNEYENPEQLNVFREFCEKCNVGTVEYPPRLRK